MGILDEAIREHLELKRRRGADPTEIERLEREALGPVRRGPEPTDALLEDRPPPGATYPEGEEAWVEESAGHPAHDELEEKWEHDELAQNGVGHEEPEHEEWEDGHEDEDEHGEAEAAWPAAPGESISPAPEPAAPPPAPPPPARAPGPDPESAGGETVEYDVEAEHAKEEPKGDDVLEETPEFLQDTPDHDRLWFEQRPPRDFDFDG